MRLQAIIGAVILAVVVAAGTGGPLRAQQPARVPVTISYVPFLLNAPIFIAIEEGYFAEQRIEPRLVFFRDLAQVYPALIAGQLDVQAAGYHAALMQAILQGGRLRMVADGGHAAPGDTSIAFMVRKDLIDSGRVRSPRDLRGMRIGLSSRAGIPEMFLAQLLRNRAILTLADVEIQQLPVPLFADAFRTRNLDAGPVPEPFVTRFETLGLAEAVVTLDEVLPRVQYSAIVYGSNLLSRNPGLGQRFMNAYLRGIQQFLQGKSDRNVAILSKHTGEDEAFLRRMPWPFLYPDGHVNVESVLQVQAWWVRQKFVDRVLPPAQFLEPGFARRAYQTITPTR